MHPLSAVGVRRWRTPTESKQRGVWIGYALADPARCKCLVGRVGGGAVNGGRSALAVYPPARLSHLQFHRLPAAWDVS